MARRPDGHEVTVAHGLFTYAINGKRKIALRGSTIEVNDEDYERGLTVGAFVDSPADLERHGALPAFPEDPDDASEIDAWMRSASPADIANALAAAAAEGRDIAALMLDGERSRGTEARHEVLEQLEQATASSATESLTDDQVAEILDGNVPDILERVGSDAELAGRLLAAESAEGGKARKGLTEGLQSVIDSATGA